MRIGVDATSWINGRGYGRFTRELLGAMLELAPEHEFVLFAEGSEAAALSARAPSASVRGVALHASPTAAASADGSRSPSDMLRMTRSVRRERLDVFFSPTVYTFFPLPPGLRAVVTIHDAIPERFPELCLPSRRARLFWRMKVWIALRQAKLILTVSPFSARELAEVLRIDSARIRVACEAAAAAYRPCGSAEEIRATAKRYGLPAGATWFTYVGGFNPHKNVDLLVRVHAELAARVERPPHLLLIGTIDKDVFHGDQASIRRAIAECGTEELVHWTGFVDDQELARLHSGALALVLPSQAEGFGLPAVEAAACGTPVIATTKSPLPELLAGGGIFVEPRDRDALSNAMERMVLGVREREEMGRIALERANALSWQRAARSALDALTEAAA